MITINAKYNKLSIPVWGKYMIIQNTSNWRECYTIELVRDSGCTLLDLPDCVSEGIYNYWITNDTITDINKLNIPETYFETGKLLESNGKPIYFFGKPISIGYSKTQMCIKDKGLLKYKIKQDGCCKNK